jgi:predicted DNA-binding ribbon-helix-helix protein
VNGKTSHARDVPVLTLIEPTHQRHRFIGEPVHKRGIRRNGCRSTLFLEEPFWLALEEIAKRENKTVSEMVAAFDRGGNAQNLSSAIRVFVLNYFTRSRSQAIGRNLGS